MDVYAGTVKNRSAPAMDIQGRRDELFVGLAFGVIR